MALGGKGVISVVANVAPNLLRRCARIWEQGRHDEARKIHFKLEPLNDAMFIETNPIPAKTALAMMGKIKEEFRLPLCEMSTANRDRLKKVLKDLKLIKK